MGRYVVKGYKDTMHYVCKSNKMWKQGRIIVTSNEGVNWQKEL
jgi:hypothetical protein